MRGPLTNKDEATQTDEFAICNDMAKAKSLKTKNACLRGHSSDSIYSVANRK